MYLRKIAGLLMAFGLVFGLIGSGVGAQFTDQVLAIQHINVGTFACLITDGGGGTVSADQKSVDFTSPTINSSAPGSAPFTFTVKNTGSIGAQLSVSESPVLSPPWSYMPITPSASFPLTAGASQAIGVGVQWSTLSNADLGSSGTVTYTVDCGEANVAGAGTAIFDNTPAVVPSNLASYGPEAYAFNEWGGGVTFAGTARNLATSTVTMSSFTCQTGGWSTGDCVSALGSTYNVPITFNVYNVAGSAVGTLITSKTQTFAIPYRPSADPVCVGADAGKWFDGTACKNGRASNITFSFPTGTTLPNTAIFGVTFDTDNYGYSHIGGANAPTNSLNIATYPGNGVNTPALVGSWLPSNVQTYLSSGSVPSTFIGSSLVSNMPTGPADDFVGYMPAVQITATN